MVPACGGARPSHLNVNYAQLVPPMPVLVKIPNFGSGGGVVPVLTTGVEMAPNGTRASARGLRTQPGAHGGEVERRRAVRAALAQPDLVRGVLRELGPPNGRDGHDQG